MTISELCAVASSMARSKGFHEALSRPDPVPAQLALAAGELVGEALEEWRRPDHGAPRYRDDGKPEGFVYELADAVIRIADLAGALGLDLEAAIAEKVAYNGGRPPLHGKRF